MLVLSRDIGEDDAIIIRAPGCLPIRVVVLESRNGGRQVRLGIDAEDFVVVNREEVDMKTYGKADTAGRRRRADGEDFIR